MAPQTPRRSSRPGKAVARLEDLGAVGDLSVTGDPRSRRPVGDP